ncbi:MULTISPECIES: DUF1996 domain-containing protein [unclassified Streptomyces]|uniref:DUF1996 domain-containing protein n=1 Tax=unclassified Streptomyces TaxID=2593676 RepID=UPI000CD4BFA6|nr:MULTISPECIES: DUF1996 domain-containing protein [unclassified Streptomyces]
MIRRSRWLSGALIAASGTLVASGLSVMSGTASAGDAPETEAPAADAHQGHAALQAAPPGEWIPVDEPVEGIEPLENPPFAEHREFQANCAPTHRLPDDPIVYPGMPGASHLHTFMGNDSTHAGSTTESLLAGGTSCLAPGDRSAYWMPTLYRGDEAVDPRGVQVIYYKSGIRDHTSVRPFPTGLRYVVGDPFQSAEEFLDGSVEGWECGDSYNNADIPAHCPEGSQLNVRYQAPSCWDGRHLDSPDHQSHMSYPVVVDGADVCPTSHPVAVPMVEFKMAFPVDGDLSDVHLSSGRGYSFHYDVFNAWDEPTLAAMVEQCINGGLQCDPRGYDQYNPEHGAVLDENYELPRA